MTFALYVTVLVYFSVNIIFVAAVSVLMLKLIDLTGADIVDFLVQFCVFFRESH